MARSEVEIINSALIKIGEEIISAPNEDTDAATKSAVLYPLLRDKLLRLYNWRFAIKRAELAEEAEKPVFGFAQQYKIPADCLRVIGIYDEFEPAQNYTTSREPWKLEGRLILVASAAARTGGSEAGGPLRIFYVSRVTNVSEFDALFTEALSWLLASELAYALSTGPQMRALAVQGYDQAIREARLASAWESMPELQQATEWVDSRAYGANGLYTSGPRRNAV